MDLIETCTYKFCSSSPLERMKQNKIDWTKIDPSLLFHFDGINRN
jgi:hypothetical protein